MSNLSTDAQTSDDLLWLVGRWRRVCREYLVATHYGESDQHEYLEYFNIYLPYADEKMTLALTTNPAQRQIAAELLMRRCVKEGHELKERLWPMIDTWPICIGVGRIWVGFPSYIEFKYRRDTNSSPPLLTLETEYSRMVFEKMTNFSVEDMEKAITNSFASAPVRQYPESKRKELEGQYRKLIERQRLSAAEPNVQRAPSAPRPPAQ